MAAVLTRPAPAPSSAPRAVSRPRRGGWRSRWPLLPLVATVLLPALPYGVAGGGGGPAVGPADLASGIAVLLCVGRLLYLRRRPLSAAAALVLGLPVVGFAVATVTAADPAAALPGLVRYLQVFVLVPVAVFLLVEDAYGFRVVAGALVLLAVVQGVTGVHQYVTGTGASYMGENIRAVGTFGPSDIMGMATVVAYGLLAATACALRTPGAAPSWLRPAAAVLAVALIVPLTLSFSRGVWIATAAAVLAALALAGRRQALTSLAVLGAAGVVVVGGFGIGSEMIADRAASVTRVTSTPDRSVSDRYAMWSAAGAMWRERPAAGVGLKGFPDHRDGHASIGLSSGSDTAGAGQEFRRQALLSPHNMYLLVLGEQGLIGLTALVGSWAAILVGAVRRLRLARSRGHAAMDCGLVAVALMTWQSVNFLYADIGGPTTVLSGVVLGLAAWWALAEPDRVSTA
ncbi:O-antigen ligase family protein [Streptomyces griseus]|uniref:O-antigen ligase family protein n=1 Tax=Streptomyces TaxID=1883 RepID=UPI0029C171D2|nr:O-antigen ligase family protein [Streptomyces sp. ID01-9D]MDX5574764.1 O-antigen ligase family protein [Streptomyces sp. ID01-9D]WTC85492.1 O-antigen ligase family protein [Streptomyces griseus]WTD71890.1 O-antigen ligase family protein [Streptomyces griseus]